MRHKDVASLLAELFMFFQRVVHSENPPIHTLPATRLMD